MKVKTGIKAGKNQNGQGQNDNSQGYNNNQ
jgi:hypothetical protein